VNSNHDKKIASAKLIKQQKYLINIRVQKQRRRNIKTQFRNHENLFVYCNCIGS